MLRATHDLMETFQQPDATRCFGLQPQLAICSQTFAFYASQKTKTKKNTYEFMSLEHYITFQQSAYYEDQFTAHATCRAMTTNYNEIKGSNFKKRKTDKTLVFCHVSSVFFILKKKTIYRM